MSFDAVRAAITAHFQNGFTKPAPVPGNPAAVAPFLPTAYENRPFKQPSGAWCRFALRFGSRTNAAVGTTHKRMVGLVYLQVFVPEDGGTKDAHDAATKMAELFDDVHLDVADGSAVQFRTVSEAPIGKTGDGWHQTNVVVDFQHDHLSA